MHHPHLVADSTPSSPAPQQWNTRGAPVSNPRWNNPTTALVGDGAPGAVVVPGAPAPPAGPMPGIGGEVSHVHGPTRNGVPYKAPATGAGGDGDGHGRDSWRNSGGAPGGPPARSTTTTATTAASPAADP